MSLLTILSLGSAFLNVAQAGHSDDVKHALYVIKDLPKSLAEPYCSKLGTSGKGAGGAYTVTEAQYTITTTLDCSSTGGYGSKPWKTSEPEASHYGGYPHASGSTDYGGGYSAPSPTYGAEYGQVTSPPYGSGESSYGSGHGGPPSHSSVDYGSGSGGSYEDPSYGGGESGGEEPYNSSAAAPWEGEGTSTDEIITLTSTTTSTYYTTSTVYFFGNVSSSVYTTSYITLAPAEPTEEPLYQEVDEETESYEDGDSSGWSAKFLHRRAEWCGDKPCRLVQYSDAVIAEACKQYGAAGGYPVGDVTTVTEYGPATETVTPTTCEATEYSESTGKPTGGYGGHEEGSHESGGFEWPSKSTAGGEPSYGGHGGHGKPTGYGSGEYGSESTSTEEAWGSKPTGYGHDEPSSSEEAWGSKPTGYGGEHGHGKPSGAWGHEESTSSEEAWGAESTPAGYPTGYGGEHGKPSGSWGHDEPTSTEAAWGADSKPTGYGGEHGHGKPSGAWGHDEPSSSGEAWGAESTPAGYPTGYGGEHGKPSGSWGHDEPTSTEAAWGADSTPTGYGGEEHGHGKPSGEWGAKPSAYGEHGGKGGKPKMCKVKHPKKAKA